MSQLTKASWAKPEVDGKVQCLLCPHNCKISMGHTGFCRVRKNIKGTLYALTDGTFLSGHLDPIEKKPLAHFHPGSLIYSVGTIGCNLRCDFCQNWELVYQDIGLWKQRIPRYQDGDIVQQAAQDGSIGIAFTYNEPTINWEAMQRLAKKAKEMGLVTVAVSNAYLNEAPMRQLTHWIDAWNIDLKSISNDFYQRICKAALNPVLRNIAIANETSHVELTTLLIEGENTADDEIRALSQAVANIDSSIVLHLSRYFPAYKRTTPATSLSTMRRAKKIAESYLDTVLLGNC